jgi:hypothetical protein
MKKQPAHLRLAAALKEIGAHTMADAAADGYYDDFKSPLAMPITQLVTDLAKLGTTAALDLRRRAMDGEFDAD